MSSSHFRMMKFFFKIRDLFRSPRKLVDEIGIKSGDKILDYGCGPGSYSIIAAETTGESGKVHALDIHPLAIKSVKKKALKKGLTNIETIQTDCGTSLEDQSIDVVMMFDVFHDLENGKQVLKEMHRILKTNGKLAFDDHHLEDGEIRSRITEDGLFTLEKKDAHLYLFRKT
ncbi:MAG: class I SAM-dependent methyltransferase [Candidatus Helarchaeota archaeon]